MRRLLSAFLWPLLCATASFAQNTTALAPQALPGLNVQVRGGTILLANSSIGISNTTVALSNNTTNYVFLSSTGTVQTNTTGFTSTVLPIATVLTAQGQIVDIQDNRPDYIFTGGGSGLPAGCTSPNGVPCTLTSTPSGGVAGAATFSLPGLPTRRVTGTGTTDTILAADCSPGVVSYQGNPTGANIFVTLPTATTLGVPNCVFDVQNQTTNGATVTITPTGWSFITPGGTGAGAGATQAGLVLSPQQIVEVSPDPSGSSWDYRISGNGPYFYAINYGVLADTQINWAPSWSSGSNIITCTSCNFLSTAKVGQIIFGTNAAPTGSIAQENSVVQLPQTTIQSIDSNTQIHTVGNANANWTVGPLIWGDDDSAGLAASWAAAQNFCGTVVLPSGNMLVQQGEFNSITTAATCIANDGANRSSPGVIGVGMNSTRIIPTPSFNFTTCIGNWGGNAACFFGFGTSLQGGLIVRDFTIWGAGYSNVVTGSKTAVGFSNNTTAVNVTFSGWGANSTGFTGLWAIGSPITLNNVEADGVGTNTCVLGNTNVISFISLLGLVYCGDSVGVPVSLVGGTPTTVSSTGSLFGPTAANVCGVELLTTGTNNFYSQGDTLNLPGGGSASKALCVDANAANAAYLVNDNVVDNIASGSIALQIGAGAKVYASQTVFQATGTTGTAISNAGTFFDNGGNAITGTTTYSGAGSIFGSASTTGTACATGNWALTSGWGTSSITSVTANGDSHRCQVVITGAAGSAGPILTWTFPKAYLIAPGSCQISFNGTLTGESTGAPSTTSVAFTFTGTPSAQTYRLDASCGP